MFVVEYFFIHWGIAVSKTSPVEMSGSLRSLEPSVSSRVRSAQSLESLAQCGLELVQNGVDAGASSLVVKVDTAAWTVKVYHLHPMRMRQTSLPLACPGV